MQDIVTERRTCSKVSGDRHKLRRQLDHKPYPIIRIVQSNFFILRLFFDSSYFSGKYRLKSVGMKNKSI